MTLHTLRHGGASHDSLYRHRTSAEVQERGDWADPRSVKRYKNPGRFEQLIAQLPSTIIDEHKLHLKTLPAFVRGAVFV